MRRALIWLTLLAVLAGVVLGDILPMFAEAHEAVDPAPVQTISGTPPDGDVAQLFGGFNNQQQQQQPRRKRRTLMDILFGRNSQPDYDQQQQQQLTPQPKTTPRKAVPPPKPTVAKAPNATRLAVFADSLGADVAKALDRFYADDPNIVVLPIVSNSSGFVRPDFFDWAKAADDELTRQSFDLAVVLIGINDRQTINADGESYKSLTDGWTQIYRARLDAFVQKFRAANKPVIWVGLPPMAKTDYNAAIGQISALQRLSAFAGGAEYVDIYDRFLDENGQYSSFGPDLNGQRVRMRKDDGIHFATGGADKLAFFLNQSIKLFYHGGAGSGFEVTDPLFGTDAGLMLRPPYQGLGEIRLLEVAGAVIPLTQGPKRADDMLTAQGAAAPDGFDMTQLIDAPIGRVDAFGVGKLPGSNIHVSGR